MSTNEAVVAELEPAVVWSKFAELATIPRPSKYEQAVIDWLKRLAARDGLACEQDEVGNVLIKKPATVGCEQAPVVVLQSHLDMVCQKLPQSSHDFMKDPIALVIEGDWLAAKGTTLGADNGIGVAAMVAVLTAKDLVHGPLECLFTVDEEAGLNGAAGLRADWLKGSLLLNLDSEDEGELYVGCAGGQDINATLSLNYEAVAPDDRVAMTLTLSGLRGGHSGVDIHRNRGNAILLMAEVLQQLNTQMSIDVASFTGGSVRNAIPREARATVVVSARDVPHLAQLFSVIQQAFTQRLSDVEPSFQLVSEMVVVPSQVISRQQMTSLVDALRMLPQGVLGWLGDMPTVVETSCNLGALAISEGLLQIKALARSSFDHKKAAVAEQVKTVLERIGASVNCQDGYPGWAPDLHSPLLKKMSDVYQTTLGHTPAVKVIHAGLECGLLGAKYPQWQMISFGPTIRYPHSPEEKVHIPSVEKFWRYLVVSLAALARE